MNKTESSSGKIFYGWWIVIACIFLGLFLTSLTNYSFTAFIEPIAYEFAWSYSQISIAASLRMMEIGLMAPVIGWLIDRWGIKKVVLAGSVIMCTGLLLFANMHSLAMYYIAFFLIGVGGSAGSQPAVQTVLAKWFHRRLGLAIGIGTAGFGISGLFIPIVTMIIGQYGWRAAAFVLLFTVLVVIVPLLLVLRNKPEELGLRPDGDAASPQSSTFAKTAVNDEDDSSVGLKQALHTRTFWLLSSIFAIQLFVSFGIFTHIMPHLSNIGIDRQLSSFIAAGIPVISIVGRVAFGMLSDKFNKKKTVTLAFIIIFISVCCFVFTPQFGAGFSFFSSFLFGIGQGGSITLTGVLTRESFGKKNFGSIYGAIMGLGIIGTLIGPFTAGLIFDSYASYHVFWLISIVLLTAALFLIQAVRFISAAKR